MNCWLTPLTVLPLNIPPLGKWSRARCLACKSSLCNTCLKCNLRALGHFYLFLSQLKIFLTPFKAFEVPHVCRMSGRQICALLAGLVGLGAIIGATISNDWKSTSRASSVITATWVFQGLWASCGGNAIGAVHCRPHLTIFKLDGKTKTCTHDTGTRYKRDMRGVGGGLCP